MMECTFDNVAANDGKKIKNKKKQQINNQHKRISIGDQNSRTYSYAHCPYLNTTRDEYMKSKWKKERCKFCCGVLIKLKE